MTEENPKANPLALLVLGLAALPGFYFGIRVDNLFETWAISALIALVLPNTDRQPRNQHLLTAAFIGLVAWLFGMVVGYGLAHVVDTIRAFQ